MSAIHGNASFHVGDPVQIALGPRKLTGVIVEDRGPIGVQARRLYRVHVPMDPFEPMMIELPEDEMEAVDPEAQAPRPISKEETIAYLTGGGLISILRSNLSGGRRQPRAWLCRDNLGNVTHTFVAERGIVGGNPVPLAAVHGDEVFAPKRDVVISFIESLGLSRRDAERVVSEIGVGP